MSSAFHRQVKAGFNRAANVYDDYAILQRQVARALFAIAEPHMADDQLWVDVGCGTGYLQELLRSSGNKAGLVQLDIASSMCEIAASYASDPEFGVTYTVNADMAALPFKKEAVDGIVSSLALQWSGDMKSVLKQLAEILKKQGWCYVSVMGDGSLKELVSTYKQLGRKAPVQDFVSRSEFQAIAEPLFQGQCEIETLPIVMHYDNVMQLMKGLRGIGASYRGKRERLASKGFFRHLEEVYRQQYGDEKGVRVTWNILCMRGKKA